MKKIADVESATVLSKDDIVEHAAAIAKHILMRHGGCMSITAFAAEMAKSGIDIKKMMPQSVFEKDGMVFAYGS